jgi:uncharacterized cupredoxin-like copper-binding protein
MKLGKIIGITVLIVLTTSLATASQVQMTFFPEESSTRIDSFTSYELTVENVGPVQDSYTFTSSSVQEIDIAPREVTLEPGQEENLNVWYNPSTDREEGTYSFGVKAKSQATGNTYSEDLTVSVIRESDVNIQAVTQKTVCRGETAQYQVRVTNDGIQKEEFKISTGYGQLSRNSVTLEDGETQTVTLEASSDSATSEEFNVRAASKTSYAQDIVQMDFTAETCYASQTSIEPENQRVAAGNTATYEVTVQNEGTRSDEFELSTNRGELSRDSVEVNAESSRTVQLSVTPEKVQKTSVKVTAEGESTSSTQAQLNSFNGNNMKVNMSQPAYSVCEEQDAEITTIVENTGATQETFTLKTDKGTLGDTETELEPGESDTVTTTIQSENLKEGSQKVTTTVTASTFGKPTKKSTATVNKENCWDVSVNAVPEVASVGENRSTIYRINVENTGTKQNTYEISYQGPEWISIGTKEVTVNPGQSKDSYMYAGVPFQKEGNVRIIVTAVGEKAEDSHTVELVVNQRIEEAIKDSSDQLGQEITGSFTNAVTDLTSGTLAQIGLAVILALLITAAILAREW